MLKHEFFDSESQSPRVLITLTSYYSYGWTKSCVSMLRRYVPDAKILVIDNNPSPNDDERRIKTFKNYPYDSIARIVKNNSMALFEDERQWLASVPNLKVIQTSLRLFHGEAINLAMQYARGAYFDVLVHVEPDCLITGSQWYTNLVNAITEGYWMASGAKLADGSLHPCPSAWSVANTHAYNFKHIYKESDYFEPQYPFLVDINKTYDFEITHWDTAKKAWYECAKLNKAKDVLTNDCRHIWAASSSIFNVMLR